MESTELCNYDSYQQIDAAGSLSGYQDPNYAVFTPSVMPQPTYFPTVAPAPLAKQKQSSLFKTQLCRHFEQKGFCNLGENCSFAHGKEELREAPEKSGSAPTSGFEHSELKDYKSPPKPKVDYSQYYKTVL